MLSNYGIDDSNLLKIAVVATMSSGKSTFINALIGQDILPSQNQACTAKAIPILSNDSTNEFKAYVEYYDGKKEIIALKSSNVVDGFNEKNEIKQILIEGNIKSIKNYNKAIVIIDTPGTNFSGDSTHREETYKLLNELKEGLIIYLVNATQLGINDDLELMLHVIEKIDKNENKLKILFIVNKIDELDLQKEDVGQTIKSIYDYIEEYGIKNPRVIPISALAAKLFKQVINRQELTRREKREFENYYDLFKANDYSLNKFAYINSKKNKTIEIYGEIVSEYDLLRAIDNTGINLVENAINELLFDKLDNRYIPKVNFNKEENDYNVDLIIKQLLKIYDDQEISEKAKKIKAHAKSNKLNQSIKEELMKIYNTAYNESSKIMMKCVINKCSDNGSIRKIVDESVNNIEIILNKDKKF